MREDHGEFVCWSGGDVSHGATAATNLDRLNLHIGLAYQVDKILSNDNLNIKGLPDGVEKMVYTGK